MFFKTKTANTGDESVFIKKLMFDNDAVSRNKHIS